MNSSFGGLDAPINVALLPEDNGKQDTNTCRWSSLLDGIPQALHSQLVPREPQWIDTMLLTYGAILLRGLQP
jgi:hypothetical protein